MGTFDHFDNIDELLYVQRIHLVDGDYAPDGTYWGRTEDALWCVFSDMNRIYVRAKNRKEAITLVEETYPGVMFHKR